jgi:hypothetical protein
MNRADDSVEARTVPTTLRDAMTGRASPAKAAVGDEPVFAYIRSVPQPQPSMGRESRGVDLQSVEDIDEPQIAAWMKQAAAIPGVGKRSTR